MSTSTTSTHHIEKTTLLHVPRDRVWRALSDSGEFGTWFGMRFSEPFTPGATLNGIMVPTSVDPETAREQKRFKGMAFQIVVDRIEPPRLFSFRWHPGAVDPSVDYSAEPMTVVTFELREVAEGTQFIVTESGFDRIPLARRASAFSGNEAGWEKVTALIEKYLAQET